MQTVELTWGRVLRFWWAALWRSVVFANLFAGAIAGILGVILLATGHRVLNAKEAAPFLDIVVIAWVPGLAFGIRSAFHLPYKDFRIILAKPNDD